MGILIPLVILPEDLIVNRFFISGLKDSDFKVNLNAGLLTWGRIETLLTFLKKVEGLSLLFKIKLLNGFLILSGI